MSLAQGLTQEEKRAARENLSEKELANFDLLTQPEPELSEKERDEVKKVAKDMLAKLKAEKLVPDWKLKTQTKADFECTIRDFYINLPKAYTPELKRTSGQEPTPIFMRTTQARGKACTRQWTQGGTESSQEHRCRLFGAGSPRMG